MSTRANLDELIEDARQQLRRSEGRLTEAEQIKDAQRAEVEKFQGFLLRQIRVLASVELCMKVIWADGHPVANLKAEDKVLRLHKIEGHDMYGLFLVAGEGVEQEITRIGGSDPHFGNRLLVAIGDAVSRGQ